VLGAGSGRTAWDLTEWIPQVTAVDQSWTMAGMFDRVTERSVHFLELRRSNIWQRDGRVLEWHSTPMVEPSNKRRQRISFLVADAAALPFPDASLDAVFSIYFTDVMPIAKLAPEIARVLKPGGCMVHFGPLDYHFDDFSDCLSAEEVREALANHGLRVSKERRVPLGHLSAADEMLRTSYENWAFSAGRAATSCESYSGSDLLELVPGVRWESSVKLFLADDRSFDGGNYLPPSSTPTDVSC
jgi:carnosine N-methyltransferase